MTDEIKKLINQSTNAAKSEDALRFSQAALNVAHALLNVKPSSDTTNHTLTAPAADAYIGFSREQASRRAQEVCRIAGETGQTVIAAEHLALLVPYIRHYKGYCVVKWSSVAGAEHYSVRVKNLSTGSEFEDACTKGKVYKFEVNDPDHVFNIWVFAIDFRGQVICSLTDFTMSIHEGDPT